MLIVGPSGSGKSTLLHLLGGLDTPTSGVLAWPAVGPREGLRPRHVAYVFQAPSLLPALSVVENIELPLLVGDDSPASSRRAALDGLQLLNMSGLAGRLPEELSGGLLQRVARTRACTPCGAWSMARCRHPKQIGGWQRNRLDAVSC